MQRRIVLVVESINVAFSLFSPTHTFISETLLTFLATIPAGYYNYFKTIKIYFNNITKVNSAETH